MSLKQPVFATDDERADGKFGWVVVDQQVAAFYVSDQLGPIGQVTDSLTSALCGESAAVSRSASFSVAAVAAGSARFFTA